MKLANRLLTFPNFKRYFFYALILKGIQFMVVAFLFNVDEPPAKNVNYLFAYSGDYKSYVLPSVNLVNDGTYYELDRGKKLYAHKMPGMMPVLAPLYFVFGYKWALTILVILQYLTDALCCVLLGKIAMKLFNDTRAFYYTFLLYALSSIVSITSHNAISELFCTSFSILAFYFLLEGGRYRNYLFAGFFAAWSVFFRPTAILLFLFMPLVLAIGDQNKFSFRQLLVNKKQIALVLLPFVVFESLWVARNYQLMGRFIPAEISYENFGTPGMRSIFSMVLAVGGDLQGWNADSEMNWFHNVKDDLHKDSLYRNTNPFPSYTARAGIELAELRLIRDKYHVYTDSFTTAEKKLILEKEITGLTRDVSQRFKTRAPFYYHVVAPARTLAMLLFIKRPYGVGFSKNGFIEKLVRGWHFISYYVPMLLYLAAFLWIRKKHGLKLIVLYGYVMAHILLYGFILRWTENRYLVPVHPYFIVISFGTIIYLAEKTRKQKSALAFNA